MNEQNKTNDHEIMEIIMSLIAKICAIPLDDINTSTNLLMYGMDSVRIIELISNLEKMFNIQIDDEDIPKFKTITDIVNYIRQQNWLPVEYS